MTTVINSHSEAVPLRPARRQRERRSSAAQRATRTHQTFTFPTIPSLLADSPSDDQPTGSNDGAALPNVPDPSSNPPNDTSLPIPLPAVSTQPALPMIVTPATTNRRTR
jgi:hypothetical protein